MVPVHAAAAEARTSVRSAPSIAARPKTARVRGQTLDAHQSGYLAGQAQRFLRVAWWMSFFPGMAIVVAVLGLNLIGDAVNDLLGGRR
jgi:xanthine/uracil permease